MAVRYQITTPEQVHFHYELAGHFSRAMAWMVDQLLLFGARIVLAWFLLSAGTMGFAVFLVASFLLDFGYFVYFELRQAGQSPGKRLFGIRVASARGGRLRFADVLIRNVMRAVDAPVPFAAVGGVACLFDRHCRRLGDVAAETLVIRDTRQSLPRSVRRRQQRENSFQSNTVLRGRILARVTRAERDLMFDLMHRRDELDPAVRAELFAQAADYFRRRYTLPDGADHLSDEQTVLNLALVVQGARFGLPAVTGPSGPKSDKPALDTAPVAG